ncbi:MAG: hypothetical protein VKJ64_06490 [Leptolyngbyaceae bacterium]|nr:hypothetical protein [Leptolyngbyaceae bacterium]
MANKPFGVALGDTPSEWRCAIPLWMREGDRMMDCGGELGDRQLPVLAQFRQRRVPS